MAQIIKTTGEVEEVKPYKGKIFTLGQLQEIVGGYIEILHLPDNKLMVVNEEGRLKGLPLNHKASILYNNLIVGDVLVCEFKQIN